MRAAVPALILLLCCTASADAQELKPDCRKAVTQMDLNIYADQDYRAADAELTRKGTAELKKLMESSEN